MADAPRCDVPLKLFINGEFVDSKSGRTFGVVSNTTGEEYCRVAEAMPEDIDAAVEAARAAFETGPWSKVTPSERCKMLNKVADLIEKYSEELAAIESYNAGKPIAEARAVDIGGAIRTFRYFAGYANKIHGKTIPVDGDFLCYTQRVAIGVCGLIVPWNFPIMIASWKLAPALCAGNTVVLKPAELTPLSALFLGRIFNEAGFPPGVVNIVPGFGVTAGGHLVKHPRVDKISFTGSTGVGQWIMQNSSLTALKRITLELGGKSPNVIFADADLDEAANGAFDGLFFNAGQCCCAGSRVYVEESIYDAFVAKVAAIAASKKVGHPLAESTQQGPVVSKIQFDRVMNYIDIGKKEGARLVHGGNRVGDKGFFIEPTVFSDVKQDMRICQEEIFGPVLAIIKFKDEEDAVRLANDSIYGLAAAVYTKDVGRALRFTNRVRAGLVWINTYNQVFVQAPFGGFKQSGFGRDLSKYALEAYTEVRCIVAKL